MDKYPFSDVKCRFVALREFDRGLVWGHMDYTSFAEDVYGHKMIFSHRVCSVRLYEHLRVVSG